MSSTLRLVRVHRTTSPGTLTVEDLGMRSGACAWGLSATGLVLGLAACSQGGSSGSESPDASVLGDANVTADGSDGDALPGPLDGGSSVDAADGGDASVDAAASQHLLTWVPPTLSHPTVINLVRATCNNGGTSGINHEMLSTSSDYIIRLPAGGCGPLWISGGHHVEIIGGTITIPTTANQTDNGADHTSNGIYIQGSTGTVHIEGVYIHSANNRMMFDAIDVNAPSATVQVENVRVDDIWGTNNTGGLNMHADDIQTWGGDAALRVDHFTSNNDYQGFQIEADGVGAVGPATIKNVDITMQPASGGAPSQPVEPHFMWIASSCSTAATTLSFSNVYYNNSTHYADGATVWPQTTATGGCASLSGSTLTYPEYPNVTGSITFGTPPGGSFVPEGVAGDGYVSPGYR